MTDADRKDIIMLLGKVSISATAEQAAPLLGRINELIVMLQEQIKGDDKVKEEKVEKS